MDSSLASTPTFRAVAYPQVVAAELAVIGEMVASLDSLTHAGRHHVMAKIVTFVQGRIGPAVAKRGAAERARINELVERLKNEAGRPLPVVSSFTDAVQRLLAVPNLFA
jgi:hypothetical protein